MGLMVVGTEGGMMESLSVARLDAGDPASCQYFSIKKILLSIRKYVPQDD